MADFDFIPINTTAEKLEKIANMDINEEILDENSNNSSLPTSKIVYDTIKELGGGEVDQTYNPESKNAQSGIAVKEAVRDKPTIHFGTKVSIPDPSVGISSTEQWNSIPPYKRGDIYINTAEKRAYICTELIVEKASGDILTKYYVTITWECLNNPVAYKYDPESSELQTGVTVAEAINKAVGDINEALESALNGGV